MEHEKSAETNGPLNAQEFRKRNPQTAPQKPRAPLLLRTKREILAGRLNLKLVAIQEGCGPCCNASISEKRAYAKWVREFAEQCHG